MNDYIENDRENAQWRERLRRAVRSEETPPYLEARIRNAIRIRERKPAWALRLLPVAAGLVICFGAVVAYELGHLRFTTSSQDSYIASMSSRVATLMRVGLRDHIHCSVFRKFPKNPPAIAVLETRLGPEYKDLIPIVRKHVPDDYRMVIAHRCGYHGRKFVHLSLKSDHGLLSLVIARKEDGESFEIEGMLPALVNSGVPFYRSSVQRFQIAAFESRDHLVYFVSDLTPQQNTQLMLALAPGVRDFLNRIEL